VRRRRGIEEFKSWPRSRDAATRVADRNPLP
jgi:hypothetical protein